MTAPRRDGNEEPWRAWVRDNPHIDSRHESLSVTDSDLWFHRYRGNSDACGSRQVQHIMLTEWKCCGASTPPAQQDTLRVLWRLLEQVSRRSDGRVLTHRLVIPNSRERVRHVRFWGLHYVRLSHQDPAESEVEGGYIEWDRTPINVQALEEVLRFDRHPYTLQPREDRRHHLPTWRAPSLFAS